MGLTETYAARVRDGQLEADAAQRACVNALARLADALTGYVLPGQRGFLDRLFGRAAPAEPPRGLYIWGEVGRGKTMLMDLFFHAAPVLHKRRVHFHAFMGEVHARIHALRQSATHNGDPVLPVAAALAQEATLLCFDECVVSNIADAMLLGRLFAALFAAGVVVVATSNVAPADLYKDGLNRALFLPFVALLEQHMAVVELAARTDFRLEKLAGWPVIHTPADAAARSALDRMFASLTGLQHGAPRTITVLGRALHVPQAANGVARFDFAQLCGQPLGPTDYLAIARDFHTLVLDNVPVIALDNSDVARRFITLIDTLYDHHVKLLMSAAAQPEALFAATTGREAFEFQRAVSRLSDMRSLDYLGAGHGRRGGIDTTGIVET